MDIQMCHGGSHALGVSHAVSRYGLSSNDDITGDVVCCGFIPFFCRLLFAEVVNYCMLMN